MLTISVIRGTNSALHSFRSHVGKGSSSHDLTGDSYIVSVPHHDGLFVDMVDDCLDEEIDGRTEDFILFDGRENNPVKENGGAEVDIILSRPKCGF